MARDKTREAAQLTMSDARESIKNASAFYRERRYGPAVNNLLDAARSLGAAGAYYEELYDGAEPKGVLDRLASVERQLEKVADVFADAMYEDD